MIRIGRKLISQFVFLLFLAWISALSARAEVIPPRQSEGGMRIRVRLAEAIPAVLIRGFDLVIQQGPGRRIAATPNESSRWRFLCANSRIRAFNDKGRKLVLQSPVTVYTPAGLLRFRSRPYREKLRIYPVGSRCEVVNELGIEKYLAGLVNAEFSSRWNKQAVEAQVIAARTYALYQIRHAKNQHYDVDATVKDQVYDGYVSEDYRGARIVKQTRGMVLVVPVPSEPGRVEPIEAFYSASCGGTTELPQNVWGKHVPGFKHIVHCPYCEHSRKISWGLNLSAGQVAAVFERGGRVQSARLGWPRNWLQVIRTGKLEDLRAGPEDAANRRTRVTGVWFSNGKWVWLPVSGVEFRNWVGAAHLKSTYFDISANRSRLGTYFHFSGRGNGHGVGMCQLGAKYMGERGFSARVILKHYYPDAQLAKLW